MIEFKNEFGWEVGRWNTPVSIKWHKFKILRFYGIKFDDKFNTLCFGRLEIRVWKPNCMRSGMGIYLFKEMPYDKNRSM
jgi:hypothetical protein